MKLYRLKILLPFLCLFVLGSASPKMTGEEIGNYIQKKLKRNNQVLRINSKNLGDDGVAYLASTPILKTVKTLILYKGHFGDEGVRALAESENLDQLTALYLENNNITDLGVEHISRSEYLSNLKVLNLYHNQISDKGAGLIAESDTLTELQELNLIYNQIYGPGVIQLTNSTKLKSLKKIELTYNPIRKSAKDAWKRFQLKEWLKELNRTNRLNEVGAGLIGDLGVEVLLQSAFAIKLERLDLKNNDLTDASVIALSQSKKLKQLISLNL